MNTPDNGTSISSEEIARRRKAMSGAVWSSRMAGLGKATVEEAALHELWITGQISHEELRTRTKLLVNPYLHDRSHEHPSKDQTLEE